MTVEIHIENFQNIQSLRLAVAGFSVLVGESNIGKTSVVRAIRCLVENPSAAAFIRHGASEAVVRVAFVAPPGVTFADGAAVEAVQIEWRRGKSVTYELRKAARGHAPERQVFTSVGRSVPEPIAALRLLRVETEDWQSLVSLVPQGRYFWPLDTPADLVRLVGELRQVVALNAATTRAKSDGRTAKKEREYHQRAADEAERALETYQGVAALQDRVDALQVAEQRAALAEQTLGQRQRLAASVQVAVQAARAARGEVERYQGLETVPLAQVEVAARVVASARQSVERYRRVAAGMAQVEAALAHADQRVQALAGVEALDGLAQRARRANQRLIDLRQLQRRYRPLVALAAPPSIDLPAPDWSSLGRRLTVLRQLYQRIEQAERAEAQAAEAVEAVDMELADWTREQAAYRQRHPNCPTCGAELTEQWWQEGHGK